MAFTYDLSTEIRPTSGPPGGTITLTAKFSNASEPVVKAFATVRMYGYFIALRKKADDTFEYTGTIPYEAPPGRYEIAVYGKAEDGTSGPEKKISFQVG
ncbi:MAG: hypothetical protein GX030_07965 [Firmicutes bacterium]|nr:hypothetical protein [Bacillota bacterium]